MRAGYVRYRTTPLTCDYRSTLWQTTRVIARSCIRVVNRRRSASDVLHSAPSFSTLKLTATQQHLNHAALVRTGSPCRPNLDLPPRGRHAYLMHPPHAFLTCTLLAVFPSPYKSQDDTVAHQLPLRRNEWSPGFPPRYLLGMPRIQIRALS